MASDSPDKANYIYNSQLVSFITCASAMMY